MKNFLSENNFLIFFLLILGISIMNVMKIVKIGLMASISSNLIHSDWCELCFSDYKEINPPESNLAEEAQKIKESKNKTENNGDKNIEKTNINGTKDESKTNPFSASKAETKENCDTSECEIIPEDIKNRMSNKMYTNNGDTIENQKNNSPYKRNYNAETSNFEDDEIGMENSGRNDFNYNSSQNRNDCNYNSENMIENIRKDFPNNREDFSNNNASNIDKNSIINTGENPIINNEEFAATNSENGEVARNNSKVNEDFYPETYNNGKE